MGFYTCDSLAATQINGFIYIGRNLISELSAYVPLSLCTTNYYVWGRDLSGTA